MSSKKWFAMLFVTIALIAVLIATINYAVDPFGAFGDVFLQKPSLGMTNNPKVGKLTYIDQNHDKYNAYILGPSGSSSLSVEKLNEYTGKRWYNMFNYGADMAYTSKLAEYLISNYEVEHILLNLAIVSAQKYDRETDKITEKHPPQIAGPNNYSDFLWANPKYSYEKIKNIIEDTYLPQKFDVFDVDNGVYNKIARDIEPIGAYEDYLSLYPEYTEVTSSIAELSYIDQCAEELSFIKYLCDTNGVALTVIVPPMAEDQLNGYNKPEVAELFKKLALVTEFVDFSASDISFDYRYFYDKTHFRNAVGDMMLAKLFDDTGVYMPDNLGVVINSDNVEAVTADLWDVHRKDAGEYTKEVPTLLYHHFAEGGDISTTLSPELFEEHISALCDAGYTAVLPEDLLSYVNNGVELPTKPILITIDDGYYSNYEVAYPILKKYGFKATIFVIGVTAGKDTYKDTGLSITPHFDYDAMKLMSDSGVISIQSHTYDMHQAKDYDDPLRKGVMMLEGESESDYIEAVRNDFLTSKRLLEEATNKEVNALSYPYGLIDDLAATILSDLGVKVTFSSVVGNNTIIKGLPQSLMQLKRYNVDAEISAEELLKILDEL